MQVIVSSSSEVKDFRGGRHLEKEVLLLGRKVLLKRVLLMEGFSREKVGTHMLRRVNE